MGTLLLQVLPVLAVLAEVLAALLAALLTALLTALLAAPVLVIDGAVSVAEDGTSADNHLDIPVDSSSS